MVVEGKQTSHGSNCLCQRRGNNETPRTDPQNSENSSYNVYIRSPLSIDEFVSRVEEGTEEDKCLVCLQPPGSTYTDNVQIVDDTVKHSPKQVHTQTTI